ncbi:hypothetical protein BKA67DRAFT_564944 [Truncatella angustata]|uniref:Eukaryotic translation initiation factor 6 n=1 Tax=Truncatella angustata TaxID=152316 RepID=A0A9P8ZX33_9PEZI|nr:uncharacterized protein BKA67DRAFT_564944 [Truncatella angustata]KAH6654392.1 hypothetical protein BKA67DRAFT_564944 [Truncatella angustata]
MSSDPNYGSDSHRRHPPRDGQPNTSGGPALPSLRSLTSNGRRFAPLAPSGTSHTGGRHGRWRAERNSERYRPGMSSMTDRNTNQGSENATHTLLSESAQSLADLGDANSRLRALLDFTPPPAQAYSELSFPSPPLLTQESADDNRRAKRRKLDPDRLASSFKGFRYGKYGQVEPGQLTMEIASCDGGIYSDDGQSYAAENILKNDASVYCTKGPRCNIVLRHQGSTAFTLKELVIKAPRQNYTSPVREGMVFISMNSDSLLARTAQYRIPYAAAREHRPLGPVVTIRHNDDGTTMTTAQIRARRRYQMGMEDDDYRSAQLPSDFTASPPPFHVTTICSDDEDDATMRSYWRPPNRIGTLPFESDESSGDELALYHEYTPRRRRVRSSSLPAAEDATASGDRTHGSTLAGEGELMAAHARLFIEPDKCKCTIRFDPPVSGRFILLKMWSPHPDSTSNIDIQAVIANGFAGPRYFPAMELR